MSVVRIIEVSVLQPLSSEENVWGLCQNKVIMNTGPLKEGVRTEKSDCTNNIDQKPRGM